MTTLKLKKNQAALVFDVTPEGEINFDVSYPDETDSAGDLAVSVCTSIGKKLATDEDFQAAIMDDL